MTAFATAADLAARLGVATPTSTTLAQWNAALDDATEYLRAVIGWHVYPVSDAVEWSVVGDGGTTLTVPPSAVVDTVTGDYAPTSWTQVGETLYAEDGAFSGVLTITADVGYSTCPALLKSFACVVASQILAVVTDLGAMSAFGVASVAIDDYRKAWSQGEPAGLDLPQRQVDLLRQRFGRSAYVTGP